VYRLVIQLSESEGGSKVDLDDFLGNAHQTLASAKTALTQNGVQSVDLAAKVFGVGLAVAFDPDSYTVLSVQGPPNDGQLMLTCGVLRDVTQDRLRVLDACNRHTQNLPAFAVYLHDAELGWDVLMQQSFPLRLLLDVPPFYLSLIEGMPKVANQAREAMSQASVGGVPYTWTVDDVDRLFTRSLL